MQHERDAKSTFSCDVHRLDMSYLRQNEPIVERHLLFLFVSTEIEFSFSIVLKNIFQINVVFVAKVNE